MSYLTLLEDETVKSNYLAILRPKRALTSFTLVSGAIYKTSFTLGQVYSVAEKGAALVQANSPTLSAGEYYYNEVTKEIYLRLLSGGNPNSSYTVAAYEIYVGTFDSHFNRDPLDPASSIVYYDPLIKKSPTIKQSQSDNLFGFMPTQSSSLTLINAEHIFEEHLYLSSFKNGQIKVYHCLGDTYKTSDIALVYDGLMSDVDYDSDSITIKTLSPQSVLDNEFRNPSGDNFFSVDTFPNLDPNSLAKPIRQVYGRVTVVPTNIDYLLDSPTTSDNRDYVVCAGQTGISELVKTISGGSTTTRTYINNSQGLTVGDSVKLDGAPTVRYVIITAVSSSPAFIEHDTIPAAMTSGNVRRGFVSRVDIFDNDIKYTALYDRDYTCVSFAGGTSGFSFNTSLESNISLPQTLGAGQRISCRVYGRVNDLTLNALPFGSNDPILGNLATAPQILLDFLKRCLGIPESRIDIPSFTAMIAKLPEPLGVSIPQSSSSGFESYKNTMLRVLKTGLLRISLNNENKWSLSITEPMGAEDKAIDSDEILDFSHSFSYDDVLSEVVIEYGYSEIHEDPRVSNPQVSTVSSVSDVARYLHGVDKSKTFESLHVFDADAKKLADRLSYVLGDQAGEISLTTKNRFFDSKIGDTINIERVAQTGFTFNGSTAHSRKAVITSTEKNLGKVKLQLTDNKGAEDNSGSW